MNHLSQSAGRPLTHILSVDVEDYFQVEAFADRVSRSSWDRWPSRVSDNTRRVLDLFDRYRAKATFFFVGWVAERFPDLVREVAARGHELACHSYWHRPVYSLSPREFREDTQAARMAIEQAAGTRVLGYRAPTWSITKDCLWALDILAEEGFVYDSSIYPIHHDLYGVPGASRFSYAHRSECGRTMREFPPATVRFAGLTLPAAGGGYLRIFPFFYNNWAFQHIGGRHGQPVVVYLHPWEFDPGQPRISGRIKSRFRQYTNLHRMADRVRGLLERYRFQSFHALLQTEAKEPVTVEFGAAPFVSPRQVSLENGFAE